MANFENKILKKKKLDKEANLKISQNEMSGRIFVEFSAPSAKLTLQKSFQDTYEGNVEAQKFAKTIKSIDDLRRYFGLPVIRLANKVEIKVNGETVVSLTSPKEKKNVAAKNNGRN
jgi:hypothetical protein